MAGDLQDYRELWQNCGLCAVLYMNPLKLANSHESPFSTVTLEGCSH